MPTLDLRILTARAQHRNKSKASVGYERIEAGMVPSPIFGSKQHWLVASAALQNRSRWGCSSQICRYAGKENGPS